MKVEVEIPEGKCCKDCLFSGVNAHENAACYYLRKELDEFDWEAGCDVKHPNCPSLREHTKMWVAKEKE